MKRALPWMASLLTACAMLRGGGPPVNTEVWARSHNASDVDVYLLCGDTDAEWLGVVPQHSAASFAIRPARRLCARGLNFFLVVQKQGSGYWAGPVRPQRTDEVFLTIEKYAGLSSVAVRTTGR